MEVEVEIRAAMRSIEDELGKCFPLKEEWKEQIPQFLHTYKSISFPDAIVEDEWNHRFMLKLSEISRKYSARLQQEFGKYARANDVILLSGRNRYQGSHAAHFFCIQIEKKTATAQIKSLQIVLPFIVNLPLNWK